MVTTIDPTLRPSVKVTWTEDYKGVTTSFRLVMDDSSSGGSYTIESLTTDATGNNAWVEFVQVTSTTADRSAIKLTPKVLSALFDAIYL